MALSQSKAVAASETYFNHLRLIRASGGGTDERSYYTPLTNLLNAIGDSLRPKVFCVDELAEQGAGHPDLGLYAASQLQRRRPKQGQIPERGVVEVKPSHDDAWLTVDTDQVSRYWDRYRLVLVTNTRDFVLLGENSEGRPTKLETFQTAQSSEEFEELLRTPQAFANKVGVRLGEYLSRILSHQASLAEPRDLAWFLASYARDGLSRVEAAGDVPSLEALRSALENALGIRFEGERGAAFFRSTLMQTLFYGVFSAWVLWARDNPTNSESFNWRTASWHLRAPVIRALFFQLSNPGQLEPLGLVELMDWASATLDRVDRISFFG
ncbi:MAG: DNA methyltransferase, partial [Chloroflexi bacterium]|nr:DNA methyltransferase [Chloroflexota bacterium]